MSIYKFWTPFGFIICDTYERIEKLQNEYQKLGVDDFKKKYKDEIRKE